MRAASRHNNRVRHKVQAALDQVAADARHADQGTRRRLIALCRATLSEVREELGPCILAGTQEDRIGVPRSFIGQRRDMQTAETYVGASGTVMVGNLIGAVGGGDINLYHNEVWLIIQAEGFDMLILKIDFVVRVEITRQRGKPQRGKQRVFDGAEEWTFRLSKRRKNHFDFHGGLSSP